MKFTKPKLEKILSAIGLQLEGSTLSYNPGDFTKYISKEYKGSARKETDEIYRMFELTLLHRESGLRIVYTTTESYYGDEVEYKVITLFIITRLKNRLLVQDADFTSKTFTTEDEVVPFDEVDNLMED